MKKIFRALVAIIALLSACPSAIAGTIEGKIVNVADGDTVTILSDSREQIKVRLYGVDCPEKRQPFGNRAKEFTTRALAGRRVTVETTGRDRYGRFVGIVRAGESESINAELIRAGLAWVYVKYCKLPLCRQWQGIEQSARAARKGLWRDSNPVPPWEWRRAAKK